MHLPVTTAPAEPEALAVLLATAWHDATCPEGAECGARDLHADSQRRILPIDALAEVVRAGGYHRDEERARVEALIEASSLGTPEAKAARESVPREIGIAIAKAAEYLGRAEEAEDRARRLSTRIADLTTRDDQATLAVARVQMLCDEWDRLSKGESMTTSAVRAALDPDLVLP